jgi:hypothetical protein
MDLADDFKECLDFSEIGLFCCDAYRSQSILQSIQIFFLVDDEQSVHAGCLQEDGFALR